MSVTVNFGGGTSAEASRLLQISTMPTKTRYNIGEQLDLTGMVVTAIYTDGSRQLVNNYTTTPANGSTLTANDSRVIVSWTANDGAVLTQSFSISVKSCNGISVTTVPNKTEYVYGETLNTAGMVLTASYSDGTTEVLSSSDYVVTPSNGSTLSKTARELTITATILGQEHTCSTPITVKYCTGIAVTTQPNKTTYNFGERNNSTGLVVTASYSDATTAVITPTLSPANNALLDKTDSAVNVTYSYAGETFTTSYRIFVKYCTGIAVTTQPSKSSYIADEQLNLSGMVVTASYNDGTTSNITAYSTTPNDGSVLTSSNAVIPVAATIFTETFTTNLNISVKHISYLTADYSSMKTTYNSGDALDTTGLVITAHYSDDSSEAISSYTLSPANNTVLARTNTSVTASVTNNGATKTVEIPIAVRSTIVTWASGTEAEIALMLEDVDAGYLNLASVWSVGDERNVTLGSPLQYTLTYVIIDLSAFKERKTSGGTQYHAAVQSKGALPVAHYMNPTNTNAGGYNSSNMKTWMDGDVTTAHANATAGRFHSLVLNTTHKQQGNTGGTTSVDTQTTSNVKYIIQNEYEVFGANSWSVGENTYSRQFDYYKNASNRIKNFPGGVNNGAFYWWSRSTYSKDTNNSYHQSCFCDVNLDGAAGYSHASNTGYSDGTHGATPLTFI